MKEFLAALREAKKAGQRNEVPIGAIIVKDGKIIARARNQTEKNKSFTAHAEILCIKSANKKLKSKYLNGCELYVTLEPCLMCMTAARLSRITKIHYLIKSPKFGRNGPAYFKTKVQRKNSPLTPSAVELLQAFFKARR